ncbi:hypothetical protein [Streptomyces sp. NPDC057438]|uniref:hypothetical protein n=1 Tax=Streptomyces sp. NPDC057438 TaxID=3346133 RepID=UPI0036B3E900
MEPEIVAALWGFGGTIAGSAVTLVATAMTLKRQAKDAKQTRTEDRAKEVGERALGHLYALRRHLTECRAPNVPQANEPWLKISRQHIDDVSMAIRLMPEAQELQKRVDEVLELGEYRLVASEASRPMKAQNLQSYVGEAIDLVSAFMTGTALPRPSLQVRSHKQQQQREVSQPGSPDIDAP